MCKSSLYGTIPHTHKEKTEDKAGHKTQGLLSKKDLKDNKLILVSDRGLREKPCTHLEIVQELLQGELPLHSEPVPQSEFLLVVLHKNNIHSKHSGFY